MQLRKATDEQKRQRDPLAWAEWGARLSRDQFLERERRLRAHPWAKESMTTWLWTGEGDSALASCETFRMTSLLQTAEGHIEEGSTHGVASVLVEPTLRGRGHASAMMGALLKELQKLPGSHASLLYSDVGARLYERVGYVPRPAFDRVFSPEAGDPSEGVDHLITDKELSSAFQSVRVPRDPFAVWPTAAQLDWHLERERIYSQLLGEPRTEACGANLGGSSVFFAGDLKNKVLRILLLSAQGASEAVALLRTARRIAHRARLNQVIYWSQPVPFRWPEASDGGGVRVERIGELPMLAPFHPRIDPSEWKLAPRALWI
jgi:GNAT superfamily N-acetyltransferase